MSYYSDQFLSSQPRKGSGNPFAAILLTAVFLGLATWAAYAWRAAPAPVPLESAQEAVVLILVERGGETFAGSGAVIDPSGLVVTNKHVVGEATTDTRIKVVFNSGTEQVYQADASIVDVDPNALGERRFEPMQFYHDWAVIKVADDSGLPYMAIGPSSELTETSTVIAAGFPGGTDVVGGEDPKGPALKMEKNTVTRLIEGTGGNQAMVLVHNCELAPGSSGGPLLNERGELVGINTAIKVTEGLGNTGENMAIPADLLREQVWQKYARTVRSADAAQ